MGSWLSGPPPPPGRSHAPDSGRRTRLRASQLLTHFSIKTFPEESHRGTRTEQIAHGRPVPGPPPRSFQPCLSRMLGERIRRRRGASQQLGIPCPTPACGKPSAAERTQDGTRKWPNSGADAAAFLARTGSRGSLRISIRDLPRATQRARGRARSSPALHPGALHGLWGCCSTCRPLWLPRCPAPGCQPLSTQWHTRRDKIIKAGTGN